MKFYGQTKKNGFLLHLSFIRWMCWRTRLMRSHWAKLSKNHQTSKNKKNLCEVTDDRIYWPYTKPETEQYFFFSSLFRFKVKRERERESKKQNYYDKPKKFSNDTHTLYTNNKIFKKSKQFNQPTSQLSRKI